MGLQTIADLIEHLPNRYETYGAPIPIAQLREGQTETIKASLISIASRRSYQRRLTIQEGILQDDSGSVRVTWFNQPYLANLKVNQKLIVRGSVKLYRGTPTLVSPEIVRDPALLENSAAQLPIYPLSGRLTTKQVRYWVRQALPLARRTVDPLPLSMRTRLKLMDRATALGEIHRPSNAEALNAAQRRMTFEELLILSLFVLRERLQLKSTLAVPTPTDPTLLKEFVSSLPYKLTGAQRKSAWAIVQDLTHPHPMNRLLEGDVGSGKTAVAAIAMAAVASAGGQVAVLVPTVVLAQQHAESLRKLLSPLGIGVGLLAGQSIAGTDGSVSTKKEITHALALGNLKVVVGTHALLQPTINFKELRLVVVDEQHRFGVEQRKKLKTKIRKPNTLPHLLSMTATPIPRTLALTLYGDLDLSVLDEMPPGRKPISTKIVTRKNIKELWADVRLRAKRGEQTFVMYPLIEGSDAISAQAVTVEIKKLRKQLPKLKIGMLHGRMPQQEKDDVMSKFADGQLDVLATTPVIEVGIDIPNASCMIIVSAERFGLAQLHQFRGRIGRGSAASVCYVCPDSATPATRKRLRLFETCLDGFTLAEQDLKERGPGELYGSKQHGQIRFKYANILDSRTLAQAKEEAAEALNRDPELNSLPLLKKRVEKVATQIHLE